MHAADPAPAAQPVPETAPAGRAYAYVGGGCFWCTEAVFQLRDGVTGVVSGYAGGHVKNPTYRQVCSGDTGHAEIIRLEYDPAKVSYADLIHLFWEAHDPTTLNRQGNDEGTQYRSIILYSTEAERTAALASREEAQKNFRSKITTEIVPLEKFYAAEDYHQNYYRTNPNQGYCQFVIAPKVRKFEAKLKKP